jgi:hypothetical protein
MVLTIRCVPAGNVSLRGVAERSRLPLARIKFPTTTFVSSALTDTPYHNIITPKTAHLRGLFFILIFRKQFKLISQTSGLYTVPIIKPAKRRLPS